MRVIVAAAGTGGHINPAIAIANKIKQKEPDSKIIFIGTPRGLENDLVPRAGYALKTIDVYGIKRKIDIENIKRVYKSFKAVGKVRKIIKEFKPDVIIGTGGYICIAVGMAANKEKVPIVLHESNAFPGVSVKLLAKKSAKILLGFEEAKTRINPIANLVVTGTPTKITNTRLTRDQIAQIKSNLNMKLEIPTVLVFGGSQGARSINNAIIGIIENNLNKKYQILWAAGKKNYENIKAELDSKNLDIENLENAKIMPYIYNMQEAMEISNLIVARSGAMTITEIAQIGRPAIFIPFPFAAENHQEFNARVLENVGAAKVILDKDLRFENLNSDIESIVLDKNKAEIMGRNANKIAKDNVEERIYSEIKSLMKGL